MATLVVVVCLYCRRTSRAAGQVVRRSSVSFTAPRTAYRESPPHCVLARGLSAGKAWLGTGTGLDTGTGGRFVDLVF